MTDAKLKELALAADGSVAALKWDDPEFWKRITRDSKEGEMRGTPLAFIVAANPATVLRLLQRIDNFRAALSTEAELTTDLIGKYPLDGSRRRQRTR